jgi:hypothetical protein
MVRNDSVCFDWIGEMGGRPGSGWDVAGVADATKDHTLIRKADVVWGTITGQALQVLTQIL